MNTELSERNKLKYSLLLIIIKSLNLIILIVLIMSFISQNLLIKIFILIIFLQLLLFYKPSLIKHINIFDNELECLEQSIITTKRLKLNLGKGYEIQHIIKYINDKCNCIQNTIYFITIPLIFLILNYLFPNFIICFNSTYFVELIYNLIILIINKYLKYQDFLILIKQKIKKTNDILKNLDPEIKMSKKFVEKSYPLVEKYGFTILDQYIKIKLINKKVSNLRSPIIDPKNLKISKIIKEMISDIKNYDDNITTDQKIIKLADILINNIPVLKTKLYILKKSKKIVDIFFTVKNISKSKKNKKQKFKQITKYLVKEGINESTDIIMQSIQHTIEDIILSAISSLTSIGAFAIKPILGEVSKAVLGKVKDIVKENVNNYTENILVLI